jgi:hypothetical protein
MNAINPHDFHVFKAKAISRGRLLERFRCHLQQIVDHADNEGDRVYFGSTNHFDDLKEIVEEMDDWNWDRIMKERPEVDPYAECRELRQKVGDLLSALKSAAASIGDWSRPTGANGMTPASPDHPLMVAQRAAYDAIAKAEGRS